MRALTVLSSLDTSFTDRTEGHMSTRDPAVPDPLSRSARWILRRIDGEPDESLTAAVVGPGTCGKSTLLDVLARRYERAGTTVLRHWPGPHEPDQPVLVDDAQLFDPAVLAELREFAESARARLVVAFRPWPRPEGLAALGAALSRGDSPVMLTHLSREAVAERVRRRLRCDPPQALLDLVHEQSGGSPPYVDIVTQALTSTGRFDPANPDGFRKPERVNVSPALAERLRYRMETLEPEIYRVLRAMAVGASMDAEVLSPLLETDVATLSDTVEAARATGLVTDSGELIAFVRNLILRLLPTVQRRALERRLAEIQLDAGGSVLQAGIRLLGSATTGRKVAATLEAAGDEALWAEPGHARALFAAARTAGASPITLAGRHAYAAALVGEVDEALRLAEPALADENARDHDRALVTVAAALAHKGLGERSTELCRKAPGHAVLAVPWLFGTGRLQSAQSVLRAATVDGSTAGTVAGAARLQAHALLSSIDSSTGVLPLLSNASGMLEPVGATVLLPDTPAALAAIIGLHNGEFAAGDSVLRRAVEAKLGGRAAHHRHQLLHGWIAMLEGRFEATRRMLAAPGNSELAVQPRDELLAAALATGLARRQDDRAALAAAWQRGRVALQTHPVDVFTIHQLGELAIAAARLNEWDWVSPHVVELERILAELGNPPLWTASLHWYLFHAALETADRTAAGERAKALDPGASAGPYAASMASAARQWLALEAGTVELDAVRDTAQRLHAAGLGWDGANLAARAASVARNRGVVAALLSCARTLHDDTARTGENARMVPELGDIPVQSTGNAEKDLLSEREREVARLVIAGLTHKQIGQRLFISTRTVEHHVARMRRRLGTSRRDEFFSRLGAIIAQADR